jgi:ABC-type transport system involved in multi-copper enzyme maturation permease subunit
VIRLVRAELYKLRTTPGPWVLAGVTLLLTGLAIVLSFFVPHHRALHFSAPTTTPALRDLVGAGYEAGVVLAPVLGVIAITGEYRHRVLTATLLLTPRRSLVLVAKVVASAVWGVFLCIFSLAMVAAMGIPLLVTQGGSLHAMWQQVGPVVPGLFGAYVLLAVYGMGIGTLVRNQIGGVILALGITLVLEPIVVAIFSAAWHIDVNFLPSRATQAVAGGLVPRASGGDVTLALARLLNWWQGALALVGWGLGLTGLGYFTTFRRDVN